MQQEKNLQQLFSEYATECQYSKRLRAETIRGYTAVFCLFELIMPEVTHPRFFTTEMAIEFFKRLQTRGRKVGKDSWKAGIKDSTVRTYWNKLNAFLVWMKAKGVISVNPLSKVTPPQPCFNDNRELGEETIKKLYSAITLHSCSTFLLRRDIAALSLFVFSGIRLNEFLSLEVRDIDLEKQLLFIRGETSKSKRSRYIPIHPTLLFHLQDYLKQRNARGYKSNYLIASSTADRKLSKHGMKHWVNSISKKSGVKFHVHQLRHFFACNLARKNVNAIKIQRLLGHSSLNMTMTYLRSIGSEGLQDDINKLSL